MKTRALPPIVLAAMTAACAGGPPSPPSLSYGMPELEDVSYGYADTTVVSISLMGQGVELSQEGVAEYAVSFSPDPEGVGVTLTVPSLSASINQPMGEALRLDEGDVSGQLVFSLDRRGAATLTETPEVSDEASQMVSGLGLANGFFPRLPGRAVAVGESWTDTISYEGFQGPRRATETTVLTYTALGDTVVDGRALLAISVEGTTSSSNDIDVSGMTVSQTSELDVTGTVLWDLQGGLMFESVKSATGSGTVRIPIAPQPLPISIRSTQRARIQQD